jgi:hypothetical protein
MIDRDRYPSCRVSASYSRQNPPGAAEGIYGLEGAGAQTITAAASETLLAAASRSISATLGKLYFGPPMTLGNAATACVRLIVWCRSYRL